MEKQRLKGFNKWVVWGVAFLGLGIMIFFLTCLPFNDGSGVRNAELFGQYGDFIGGVVGTLFALFGFIYTLSNLAGTTGSAGYPEKRFGETEF